MFKLTVFVRTKGIDPLVAFHLLVLGDGLLFVIENVATVVTGIRYVNQLSTAHAMGWGSSASRVHVRVAVARARGIRRTSLPLAVMTIESVLLHAHIHFVHTFLSAVAVLLRIAAILLSDMSTIFFANIFKFFANAAHFIARPSFIFL